MRTHNEAIDLIESLVDQLGTAKVLDLLAEVCSAKADHIRETWQDSGLADDWDTESGRILGYAIKPSHVVQP